LRYQAEDTGKIFTEVCRFSEDIVKGEVFKPVVGLWFIDAVESEFTPNNDWRSPDSHAGFPNTLADRNSASNAEATPFALLHERQPQPPRLLADAVVRAGQPGKSFTRRRV
jgi:hypothetical protein